MRGYRQAEKFAGIALSHTIDFVLSSPATRTRETIAPLLASARPTPTVVYEPKIYNTCVEGLIDILLATDAAHGSVLLVGHNPTISELADALAGPTNIPETMSPATWVVLEFEGDWLDLGEGLAKLLTWDRRAADLV